MNSTLAITAYRRARRIAGRAKRVALPRLESASIFALKLVSPAERAFQRSWPLIDSVEGFLVSPAQERWLFKTAWSLPDGATIVEIGSYKGRSTCCMALACRGTAKRIFAIDTFEGNDSDFQYSGFFPEFQANLERCGVSRYVKPVRGWSSEVAREWRPNINMLFIDGSHQYEDVLADFENFLPFVVPGGVIALHDIANAWPGPTRAWKAVVKRRLVRTGECKTLGYGQKP
jgi:predicted O-methyltransferase YrrM